MIIKCIKQNDILARSVCVVCLGLLMAQSVRLVDFATHSNF